MKATYGGLFIGIKTDYFTCINPSVAWDPFNQTHSVFATVMMRVFVFLAILPLAFASDNGKYYECDTAELENNQCIFALTSDAPTDWRAGA